MSQPKLSFELKRRCLKLDQILPVRQIKEPQRTMRRYATILESIKEVGVIEPLVVYPKKGEKNSFLLLDGHFRYFALKELKFASVECIVSTDDESFTYNARISRIAPIQEHRMINKAVQNGVSPERIASALNLPVKRVKASMALLDGINEEAADLLKEKQMSPRVLRALKKVSEVRQIEIAELMVDTNNFTAGYAEALLLGTPNDHLKDPIKPKTKNVSVESLARMEEEMAGLERDFRDAETSYSENFLQYTLLHGYIKKLLANPKVAKFLNSRHGELVPELQKISASEAL